MKRCVVFVAPLVLLLVAGSACRRAALKPPTLQLAALKFTAAGITGAKLNVTFNIRNVNPTPLVIESLRYDLNVNGNHLGSGYYSTRMELAGMAEQKVTSVFDLNWLALPGAVQSMLQQDTVQARVVGKYFIAGGSTMNFSNQADVSLTR